MLREGVVHRLADLVHTPSASELEESEIIATPGAYPKPLATGLVVVGSAVDRRHGFRLVQEREVRPTRRALLLLGAFHVSGVPGPERRRLLSPLVPGHVFHAAKRVPEDDRLRPRRWVEAP